MKTKNHTFLSLAALALAAGSAHAQITLTPTDVLASSSGFGATTAVVHLIDSSGLTDVGGDGEDANDTHNNPSNAATMWIGGDGLSPGEPSGAASEWLIFDLGGVYDVESVLVWNHNQSGFTRLGVESMDILATATGTSVNDASGFAGLTTVSLTQGSGAAGEAAQTRALSFSGVRFIRFENFDTFSVSGESFADHAGLSEVRFQIDGGSDSTPPTLDSFADNVGGGPISDLQTVTYTVTFSEPMTAATVEVADFENAGSPAATINSVTATANPAVYEVSVSPGSGAGTLQLQVVEGANLEDLAMNALVTTPVITDPAVITVSSGGALTLTPTDVLASSSGFGATTAAVHLIDSSGLTDVGGDGEDANDTHNNPSNGATMWIGGDGLAAGEPSGAASEWLIFDLGGLYDVTSVLVWNHNQSGFTRLGVESMDILATATGTSVNDASGFAGLTTVSLTQGSGAAGEAAQTRPLSFSGVRFIRFENFDTFSVSGESYADHAGLSEVRFQIGGGGSDPVIADIRHLGTMVELDLEDLESGSTYKVFRDTTLPLGGSKVQVGSDVSGVSSDTVTDSSPPADKAFYQAEEQ